MYFRIIQLSATHTITSVIISIATSCSQLLYNYKLQIDDYVMLDDVLYNTQLVFFSILLNLTAAADCLACLTQLIVTIKQLTSWYLELASYIQVYCAQHNHLTWSPLKGVLCCKLSTSFIIIFIILRMLRLITHVNHIRT